MYQGRGFDGIVRVAAGMVAAIPQLPHKRHDFGTRLGPVVGKVNDKVFKAYDQATTRSPNHHLIRNYVDPEAVLWTTTTGCGKLEFLEMNYFENIWNRIENMKDPVPVQVFESILEVMNSFHKDNLVHGDIRLANLLSSGKVVDLDFVGKEGEKKYPQGLQQVPGDGKRHTEVSEWIADVAKRSDCDLTMKREHDLHSMKQVMSLFAVHTSPENAEPSTVDKQKDAWEMAKDQVQKGKVDQALETLKGHSSTMKLELNTDTVLLIGTGTHTESGRTQDATTSRAQSSSGSRKQPLTCEQLDER